MTAPTNGPADLARAAWRATPAGYGLRTIPGYKLWRHIDLISREYVRCMSQPGQRLIINVQNQVGKSLCTSVLGPTWILDHWPHLRVMLIAHGIQFASRFGRQARNLAVDNPTHFRRLEVVGGREAMASNWETTAGGGMFSTSMDRVAGNPADRIVIDDPYASWKDAHSELTRESVWDSWQTDVQGRIRPETSVCLTMTRYHAEDLTGRLKDPKRNPEAARWRVVRLPALAEDLDDPLGRRPGDTIDPHWSREFMLNRKANTSSYFWAGMYQQRPSPSGGGIIKRSWWKWYKMRPGVARFDEIIQSWDMAFKETATSSYVVGQVWGRIGGDFYLLDQVRDRMDFPATIKAVEMLTAKWPGAQAKLIEDKANGPAVIATLARKVPGLIAVGVDGSKEARLHAVSPVIESGNVWLPDPVLSPWIGDFVEECVVGSTMILTRQGLKAASEIEVGDEVLTHRGRFRPVTKATTRMADNLVTLHAKNLEPLTLTADHPVLAMQLSSGWRQRSPMDVSWRAAGDVQGREYRRSKRGQDEPTTAACDALVIPVLDPDYDLTEIDLREWYDYPGPRTGKGRGHYVQDDGETIGVGGKARPVRYRQVLDYRFGRLCGLWLAEGSVSTGRAQWSFNAKEDHLISEVLDTLRDRLGLQAAANTRTAGPNCMVITLSAPRLVRWFETFGHRAVGKRIPEWAWNGPVEFHRGIVDGWLDGDGYGRLGTTVSPHLAWGMRILATRLGHWAKLNTYTSVPKSINGRPPGTRLPHWRVDLSDHEKTTHVFDGEYVGCWVRRPEAAEPQQVFNFAVEEDESYVTTGGAVHNCSAFPTGSNDDQVDATSQALARLTMSVGLQSDYAHEGGRR